MAFNMLIVDDSDVMRKVVRRVITLSGIDVGSVYEADNGESALKVLDENWVDVVLSDINMPVMDGVELLKKIKSTDILSDIPVIMVTTEGRSARIEELREIGASGYITKPFKPEDLRAVMCEALGVSIDEQHIEESEDDDF